MKTNQKGFIPILVAIIVVLVAGGGVYVYSQDKVEEEKDTNVMVNENGGSVKNDASVEVPYLGSLYPQEATVGSVIHVRGSKMIGDQEFIFERADGKTFKMSSSISTFTTGDNVGGQRADIILSAPITTGVYKVYAEVNGQKTSTFTVTVK